MKANPYETMAVDQNVQSPVDDNRLGRLGFTVSIIAAIGLFAIGPLAAFGSTVSIAGTCLAFLAIPGLIISAVGLFSRPRRLARWGCMLGLYVSLHLPTLIHPWLMQ